MGSATEQLLSLVEMEDRHDLAPGDLLPLQIEAANERLQSRVGHIRLLANRAQAGGVSEIRQPSDLVPLLFAHTTYKSYTESWLSERRWDRMSKWLETVSTHPIDGLNSDGVNGLDQWLQRLETVGHYVTCSSGTTGKPAMLSCSAADLDFSGRTSVAAFSWATNMKPEDDRKMFGLGPSSNIVRNQRISEAMTQAFASQEEPYRLPLEPITVGSVMAMVMLRKQIADGTARPSQIAEYEELTATRQGALDAAIDGIVDALIQSRHQKLLLAAQFASLYEAAQGVRAKGYSAKDFQPDTALLVGGGLKGNVLPADYKDFIYDTFNVRQDNVYHLYSMQELNTPFPMCAAGRYHAAPWVMVLPLDATGDNLVDYGGGEVECRAAFFDVSLDGRWGGVISGDRITVDFRACACGHQGPTVGPDITRYADLPGGDKISCAGTIDAYIRGVA